MTPEFITNDPNQIISEIIADYESRTGKVLQPAQAERLLIQAVAYRESLLRSQIQDAALMNLVEFSRAPIIDYLGQLVGVTRLASSPATTNLQFTLVAGHGGVTIEAGTRVQTVDGLAVFQTDEDVNVNAGITTATVGAFAQTAGTVANGYIAGKVTIILDPEPFIVSVTNTTTSVGGSDEESDDELRERIKLAPASFSNAGSYGAYKFHAKSAHPSIVDVFITSPQPGDVEVYPLVETGEATPLDIIEAVEAALNDEKIRPLTDFVFVISPTRIDLAANIEITVYDDALNSDVEDLVNASLEAFAAERRSRLGLDVLKNHIIKAAMVEGVYQVNVPGFVDQIVAQNEFVYLTFTVTIIGSNVG